MQIASHRPHGASSSSTPNDAAYLIRKIIWRSWIRTLSWLRRHHALPI
jgi:hypothetical protein